MTIVAITLVGADRAGLVGSLAEVVAAHDGNWLRSHMANLAGQFAGIVEVEVPASGIDNLSKALQARCGDGLQISMAIAGTGSPTTEGRMLALELLGQDHPGIVKDIAQTLAARQISVEELETDSYSASMSGEMMFSAKARLIVPAKVTDDELDQALQHLSNSLMIEVSLAEAKQDN